MDSFRLKTDQEIKKMIDDFWSDLEYLSKLRILLLAFPEYSITKLESRGIGKLWLALSLEQRKNFYEDQYKYQI